MLSNELEYCLNDAFRQARAARHALLTVEHLLHAILTAPHVSEILRACGADPSKLQQEIWEQLLATSPLLPEDSEREVQPTVGFQRVLQRAVFSVQSRQQGEEVGVTHVLLALFSEKQSQAVFLLKQHGVTRLDVVRIVSPDAPPEPEAVSEPRNLRDASTMRIGTGLDVHAFGPGDFVMLAGVRVPYTKGVVAHSDGDVVLHAVCDALLGAAGLGDIGEHFRDSDPQWRGADSKRFVNAVMEMLATRCLRVVNADVTVLAEAPKLATYRSEMRRTLAGLLQVAEDHVNIKATTTERLGFIGRGEGIAAQAVVLLETGGVRPAVTATFVAQSVTPSVTSSRTFKRND